VIDKSDYPLWHGPLSMSRSLRDRLTPDDFLVSGEGVRVRDRAGRWYLDGRSSLWHGTLGYSHPKVVGAIERQLRTLSLGTLLFYDRPPEVTVRFARALAGRLPAGLRRIRFGSTGSQLTEAAILLSRFHRRMTGQPDRTAVVSLWGSYHGMGAGASRLSGMLADRHDRCGPLLSDVHHADFTRSWAGSVTRVVDRLGADRVTAVIVEPVMGHTGVFADVEDLRALASFCRSAGVHFIADEVSTGYGRVGALSRVEQLGIVPDMLVLAKGMTAGYLPAGVLAVADRIYDDLADTPAGDGFPHGSTMDGNPLAAAAGSAVLDVLYGEGLIDTVDERGKVLHDVLCRVQKDHVSAGEVAGAGLLQRLALRTDDGFPWSTPQVDQLRKACEEQGLLVSGGLGCICVLPPLVITDEECAQIGDRLDAAFTTLRRNGALPAAVRTRKG
jgi:adenosylmethionine-8-amino-7-oxononanoate aminotransferase